MSLCHNCRVTNYSGSAGELCPDMALQDMHLVPVPWLSYIITYTTLQSLTIHPSLFSLITRQFLVLSLHVYTPGWDVRQLPRDGSLPAFGPGEEVALSWGHLACPHSGCYLPRWPPAAPGGSPLCFPALIKLGCSRSSAVNTLRGRFPRETSPRWSHE